LEIVQKPWGGTRERGAEGNVVLRSLKAAKKARETAFSWKRSIREGALKRKYNSYPAEPKLNANLLRSRTLVKVSDKGACTCRLPERGPWATFESWRTRNASR